MYSGFSHLVVYTLTLSMHKENCGIRNSFLQCLLTSHITSLALFLFPIIYGEQKIYEMEQYIQHYKKLNHCLKKKIH